ncbi:MAG: YjjG family noncanonical pyrimidine nucleotidase [Prevotella sp.]|nr:YjjG family noncanonical pyrimidine nucleotidase [Prevotella sp.]
MEKNKVYKDLFVDFDDTLYDTHGNSEIAIRETFEYYQLGRYFADPQVFYDAYWEANIDLWGRYSKGEITRDFLIVERFRRPLSVGMGDAATEAYCLEMSDQFLAYCSNKPGTVKGAHELMQYLREKGYRMHMTSNGFHEVQYKKLAACGLRDYFDTIVLSEDAGVNKPAAGYFEYAFKQTGAKPETTLMIGDNLQTDIKGAMAVGIDALLFNRWGYDIKSGDPEAPTYTVSDLLDIKQII